MPYLRKPLDAAEAVIDDHGPYIQHVREFHTELVARCGNDAIALVVGALEAIWSAHVDALARLALRLDTTPLRDARVVTSAFNEKIYRCIEAGDAPAAARTTQEFFSPTMTRLWGWERVDTGRLVEAGLLRHTK